MSGGLLTDTMGNLINQAIDDGAQIISISQGTPENEATLQWALARAMSEGVIVVASAGNTATDNSYAQLIRWSGVVGVSAINSDGTFASYSSWGNGVVTAAFGGPVNIINPSTHDRLRYVKFDCARLGNARTRPPEVAQRHHQPNPPVTRPLWSKPESRVESVHRLWSN